MLETATHIDAGLAAPLRVLTDKGERRTRLRASSLFTGVLSDAEGQRILAHATDIERLKRAALRRATWCIAASSLRQQITPAQPKSPNRAIDPIRNS